MGGHFVGGDIEGVDGFVGDVELFGVLDTEHGGGGEDWIGVDDTGGDIFLFEEFVVGGGVVVAKPEFMGIGVGKDNVHALVIFHVSEVHLNMK